MPKSQALQVNWSRAQHRKAGHHWEVPTETLKPHPLEECLSLPQGTLQVINAAFEQNLDRFTRWRLPSGAKPELKGAVKAAARLYKRGVQISLEDNDLAANMDEGSYTVRFLDFSPQSDRRQDDSETFHVLDDALPALYPMFRSKSKAHLMHASEQEKNLQTVGQLVNTWKSANKPKHWVIIGGGITLDLGAFAAALCDCTFTLVPTTLLAMADACIGGKTGVNAPPYGKNQMGLFAFPNEVLVDLGFLRTQSDRDFRSGVAECLKHAILISDVDLATQWSLLSQKRPANMSGQQNLIMKTMDVKRLIVKQDTLEQGVRATLNLGHTAGHALEGLAEEHSIIHDQRITHGEAVAIGLSFALTLSLHMGTPIDLLEPWQKLLNDAKVLLPRSLWPQRIGAELSLETLSSLMPYLKLDKKQGALTSNQEETQWVILLGEEKSALNAQLVSVSPNTLRAAWNQFVESYEDS